MNNYKGIYPKQIKFDNNVVRIALPGNVYKNDVSFGLGHDGLITIILAKSTFTRTESFDKKMAYYTSKPHAMIPIKVAGSDATKYETVENLHVRFLEEADTDPSLVDFDNLGRVPRLLSVEYERIVDSNKPVKPEYHNQIMHEVEGTQIVEVGYYQHDEYVTTDHIIANLNRLAEIAKKDAILDKIKNMSPDELTSLVCAIYRIHEEILDKRSVVVPSYSAILDCKKRHDSILVEYKYYPDKDEPGYRGIDKVYEETWLEFELLAELTHNNLETLTNQKEIDLGELYEK